jgi:transposase
MKTRPENKPLIKRAIAYINKGYTFPQISRLLNVPKETITYWKHKYGSRNTTAIPINSYLIRTKQYSKMDVDQLRALLWIHRELRRTCEKLLWEEANVKSRF